MARWSFLPGHQPGVVWSLVSWLLRASLAPALAGSAAAVPFPSPDWARDDPERHGFDSSRLAAAAAKAQEELKSGCMAVVADGLLVGEWYFEARVVKRFIPLLPEQWTANTTANVHSSTKSITAALVGIAQDHGLLSVHDPAYKYIPTGPPYNYDSWAPPSDKADVTIADLLAMDSGIFWTAAEDYIEGAGLARDKTSFALGRSLEHKPRTWWEYNNMGVQVLEAVLRNATGEDPAHFAKRTLFDPIGLGYPQGDVEWIRDAAGNPTMYDGVLLGCRGLARMGYLWLNNGTWDGRQVVSQDFVRQSTSPSTPLNADYGYLWWLGRHGHWVLPTSSDLPRGRREGYDGQAIPNVDEDAVMMLGADGQFAIVQPSQRLVITRMGDGDGDPSGRTQAMKIAQWVREARLDAEASILV